MRWAAWCSRRSALRAAASFASLFAVPAALAVVSRHPSRRRGRGPDQIQTNLTIAIATGFVGAFGPAAIAGYGTGSRLEYLLIPLVFGLGGRSSPWSAPISAPAARTCAPCGLDRRRDRNRALRDHWPLRRRGPRAWLSLFDTDPAMIDAGSRYLHAVGPVYGLFGLGMALYFASQGAGRLLWPLLGNMTRLLIAAVGGWLALRWTGNLTDVFIALAIALAAFGLINAAAVASGVWFKRSVAPHLLSPRDRGANKKMTEQYLEDFAAGQVFGSGRLRVDKEQIIAYARQFDPQPYHLDEEAARKSPFRGLAASGWHTAAMTMRLLVDGEFSPPAASSASA